jgi:hypothetical protein
VNLTELAGSQPPVGGSEHPLAWCIMPRAKRTKQLSENILIAFRNPYTIFTGVVYYVSGFTPASLSAAKPDSDSAVVSEFSQGLVAAAPQTLSQMVIMAKPYTFHASPTGRCVIL